MKDILPCAVIFIAGLVLTGVPGCAAPNSPDYRQVTLGLCEDYPKATRTLDHARSDLKRAHDAGAKTLRIAFSWLDMEPEPGRYDFSFWDDFVQMATTEYGLSLIPYVCYTPEWASSQSGATAWKTPPRDPQLFGRFVSALVTRYRGRIHSWELWNEPDNADFWTGSTKQYAALVRAGSKAVRAADPSAKVVLGGLAWNIDFLEKLFRKEAISHDIDVVNLHAYFETWSSQPLENLPAYINRAAAVVALYGDGQDLWLAEVGYSSYRRADGFVSADYTAQNDYEHTPVYQGDALLRSITLALSTGKISLLAWYRINDLPPGSDVIGDVNNCHLGVMDFHEKAKPALSTFRLATTLFAAPYRPLVPVVIGGRPGARVYAFQRNNGTVTVLTWVAPGPHGVKGDEEANSPLNVTLPLGGSFQFSELDTKGSLSSLAVIRKTHETTLLHLEAGRERIKIYELIQ